MIEFGSMGAIGTYSQKCNNGCVVYCWLRKREVQNIKLAPIPTPFVRFGIAKPGIDDVTESAAWAMRVCSLVMQRQRQEGRQAGRQTHRQAGRHKTAGGGGQEFEIA